MELDELERHIIPLSLKKALEISKKHWGRIEWNFLQELGFLHHIQRDRIEQVYARLQVYHNTTQSQ